MATPSWAETEPGVSWADTPREDKLAEWTASMQPSISGWLAQLPEDFVEDYSRASLAELEQVLLDRYPDAATMVATGSLFAETAARYAGQSWLQVCGGRWDWTRDDPRSVWPDQPVVRPDTRSQVPVPVFARIRDVVADRTGTALTRTWDALDRQRRERADAEPGWTPQPPDTDPDSLDDPAVLAAFTAARDTDLARWAEISGAPVDTWDLSLDSLDTLGRLVLDRGLTVEQICRPAPDTWQWLAARYTGETMLHLGGGTWHWQPNTEGVELTLIDTDDAYLERFYVARDDPGGESTALPDISVGMAVHLSDAAATAHSAAQYLKVWARPTRKPNRR